MKRVLSIALALVLALSMLGVGGCKKRMVTVKTGEIVICTAGEVVEDNTEEIEVPENEVIDHSVKMRVITCEEHAGGDIGAMYDRAQEFIRAGGFDDAKAELEKIVAKDPTYKKAKQQLDDINAGKKPAADADSTPGDTTADDTTPDEGEEPVGPIANLARFVPDTIAGYSAQGIVADPASITRNYLPTSGNADLMAIMAEQTVDASTANDALDAFKTYYPDSSATVKIGSVTGVFGVRESNAAIAFTSGAIVVTVELHAKKGDAKNLKDALVKVGNAIAK